MTAPETQATDARRRMPAAWQRRPFRRLAGAWVFSNIGDSALFLMMAVWVNDLTGSGSAAAIVFVMFGLAALSAPFLGEVADRFSRRKLLALANAAMVPLLLVLLFVQEASDVWIIYVVMLLYGCVGYLTAAAQSGLIRDLLPDEELASGNGLLSTIDQAARLLSPLIGTALYVFAGPVWVIGTTMATFAIASVLIARIDLQETPPTPAAERAHYWTELGAGVRHIAASPMLALFTIVITVAFASTGLSNATIFPALGGLGLDSAWLGIIVTAQGVGSLIGGITAARVVGRLGESRTIALGVAIVGLGLLPTAGWWAWLAVAAIPFVGLGVVWVIVAYATHRQRTTPARLQGRVGAAANLAINVPQTLATLLGAALLGIVDYRLLIVANVLVVLGAAVAAVWPRRVRADAPAANRPRLPDAETVEASPGPDPSA
ncbi:MFS transporter [Agromyces rhizosphaerae]|uniref:MFS transporter n=1 Tax=Agromyces rhizosphaerae TaxID=88374 RepID=A0A9W6CSP5_9MICO|nr:MFS transporter [Agromyces rhizosphaerae]GLI28271.1 MFS transporter [Agromyces rhizosphaerae]